MHTISKQSSCKNLGRLHLKIYSTGFLSMQSPRFFRNRSHKSRRSCGNPRAMASGQHSKKIQSLHEDVKIRITLQSHELKYQTAVVQSSKPSQRKCLISLVQCNAAMQVQPRQDHCWNLSQSRTQNFSVTDSKPVNCLALNGIQDER